MKNLEELYDDGSMYTGFQLHFVARDVMVQNVWNLILFTNSGKIGGKEFIQLIRK